MFKSIMRFSIFCILFLLINLTYSQEWIKTFPQTGDDKILAATTDRQGNIYLTGYITRIGSGIDIQTVKLNSAGQTQWTTIYDGPGHGEDKAFGIAVDNTGQNVFITGYTTSLNNNIDIVTIKYTASTGVQAAINRFGDPSNLDDKAFGIAVDRLSNVYITGYITRPGIGADIYTAKYTSNLVFVWQKTFVGNGNGEDKAFGIVTDSLGLNIFITGFTTDSSTGSDMVTISYDSSGTGNWEKFYHGNESGEDKAFGIAVDRFEGGGIYITGYSNDSVSKSNITTIKYNPVNGNQMWVAKYYGSGNADDKAFGIVVDRSGNSYVVGTSEGQSSQDDYITVKFAANGDTLWSRRYNGPGNGNDSATSIVISKSFDYVFVTGTSPQDSGANKEDIVTIKYGTGDGDSVQASVIDMYGKKDVGVKCFADTSGNIFVAGYTFNPATDYDWLAMKYHNGELVIGIHQISTEVPSGFVLFQNYPNPFNPATMIRFAVPSGADEQVVQLKIYDILGREVEMLVNKKLKPGIYEADWDASKYSSGVYFYTLNTGDFNATKRMVLIK